MLVLPLLDSAIYSLAWYTFLITYRSGFVAPLIFCILNVVLDVAAASERLS